ncbi:TNFAIP3 interacting protein 1 S homeolog [Xenopus laevis]|uniref:LOC495827 protein n=2 Tax=Xenopus laevis TaxID=8355 RepID=Q5RJX7_XENLA|nr:TNFAIP3 interacting protein 1 S homeolog [Xenopus laevis]AAH86461.1 LOC495827 protein [Xenopus laevis]OCT86339.1 hypothetical protein XELAEV_18020032mg [Xenopus laevis]
MESKGPYRIYDPGGSEPSPSINKGVQLLMKDNPALRENMEGIKSLGELLEESENEVHRLRQKAEALVKDNKHFESSSSLDSQSSFLEETVTPRELGTGSEQTEGLQSSKMTDLGSDVHKKSNHKTPPSGSSSEFEILNAYEARKTPESRKSDPGPTLPQEDDTVQLHLQRMETSLSMFAEEPDRNRLLAHISRLALDFNRLANKVHKNEQKTSVLQTLCEQLRKENEDLRAKLEADWNQRTQAEQALRYENLELKKLILQGDCGGGKGFHTGGGVDTRASEGAAKLENSGIQQVAKLMEKPAVKDPSVSLLKKVKILEHQRTELLDVNKQWDQQFRSMKMQYEEKITSLRQKLSKAAKAESEQEAERDRKQRDFDRKLLLARDKIEDKELQIQKLESELRELKQKSKFLHEQLSSTSKQREYQEREIIRLNKALEEALNMQGSGPFSPSLLAYLEDSGLAQQEELKMQNDVLKQQVKIFEEDFQKERRDRERMNEEKEELKRKLELLQTELGQMNTQLRSCQEDLRRERETPRDTVRQQTLGERYIVDPHMGHVCPPYQYPYRPPGLVYPAFEDWQIRYPPPVVHPEHSQVQDVPNVPPPAYPWRMANVLPRMQNSKTKKKEQDVSGSGTQNAPRQT